MLRSLNTAVTGLQQFQQNIDVIGNNIANVNTTGFKDARSEFEVFERFAELTLGKMALFISHRFSTVRMADRIIVLENGKIVEEGNHDQLTRRGGRYAEMFEMQAASYR